MTGALALTAVTLPSSRSPRGEFLAPFTLFQTPPPMAPMAKAPPMSSKMRCGQGSRSWTDIRTPRARCVLGRSVGEGEKHVTFHEIVSTCTVAMLVWRSPVPRLLAANLTRAPPSARRMELQMQSGRGGGLADALKQYGVLRSHSITQQAGIQIEEKKLHILEKRLDEEKQKVSPPPCLPPRSRRLAHAIQIDNKNKSPIE